MHSIIVRSFLFSWVELEKDWQEKLNKMQTDIKITCCEAHSVKDIQGYCNDCGKPFCKECVLEHIGHKMMKIKDFCEEKKISIYKLAAQLEEKRKRMIEITTKLLVCQFKREQSNFKDEQSRFKREHSK